MNAPTMANSAATQRSFPRVPVIVLTARVSKLVLRSGKATQQPKIIKTTISKLPRNQKTAQTTPFEKDLSLLSLSKSKEIIPFRVPSECHSEDEISSNQRTVHSKENDFKYTAVELSERNVTTYIIDNDLQKENENKKLSLQLLHPDWRRVPWQKHYGWTSAHQQLYEQLKIEVIRQSKQGCFASVFYSSAEEHVACGLGEEQRLSGPSVSNAYEALEVIRTRCQV